MVNVPTSLNDLKTKVDDLDFGKVKSVPVDLKKVSNLVEKEVIKNTKFSTLNTKVNRSEKKIYDATTLIHINQYNTDEQNLEKKIGDVDKKMPDTSGLVTTTFSNTKISEGFFLITLFRARFFLSVTYLKVANLAQLGISVYC